MKKTISAISMTLVLLICLSAFTSTAAYAEERSGYEKRELTAYLYGKEKTTTKECLFFADKPSVPYINPAEFLSGIYTSDFSQTNNGDGIFTVTKGGQKMLLDANADTVTFERYELFVSDDIYMEGNSLSADYGREMPFAYAGEPGAVTVELAPYGLDIVEADGTVYLPLATLSDMFAVSYNAGVYYDGAIYYIHAAEPEYMNRSAMYDSMERDVALIDFDYRELCFVMDHFYGMPTKAKISESIREKGFDKTLDEFSDDTRRAKELLYSKNRMEFFLGLVYLYEPLSDGGHSLLTQDIIKAQSKYNGSVFANAWTELTQNYEGDGEFNALVKRWGTSVTERSVYAAMRIVKSRQTGYSRYEEVKRWNDSLFCLKSGNTMVFVFDSFINDVVPALKWTLDCAEENGIKNFLLDDSCNSGGSSLVLGYIYNIITNKANRTNVARLKVKSTFTGNSYYMSTAYDLNLDGKIDDADKDVVYDFNFALLTSDISFSCGNLLPVMAKESGIAILGETSAGGECSIGMHVLPSTEAYAISSEAKLTTENGTVVDLGAAPDYVLTKKVTDQMTGKIVTNYDGLYNLSDVGAKIHKFYGDTLLGDADGDCRLSINDVTAIQRHIADIPDESFNETAADVDGSGEADINDATLIQRFLADFSVEYPVGEVLG